MSDTVDSIAKLELAIKSQNEINTALTLAEREKTVELQRQTAEIEAQRKAREEHTKTLNQLVISVTTMVSILRELLDKRHFENVEQLMEILIPILSQVSTSLTLRSGEIDRLERLITETRRSDINVGQTIRRLDNQGTANING